MDGILRSDVHTSGLCIANSVLVTTCFCQSYGDILDDSKAVEALAASKALALDIEEKQVSIPRFETQSHSLTCRMRRVAILVL